MLFAPLVMCKTRSRCPSGHPLSVTALCPPDRSAWGQAPCRATGVSCVLTSTVLDGWAGSGHPAVLRTAGNTEKDKNTAVIALKHECGCMEVGVSGWFPKKAAGAALQVAVHASLSSLTRIWQCAAMGTWCVSTAGTWLLEPAKAGATVRGRLLVVPLGSRLHCLPARPEHTQGCFPPSSA